MAVSGNSSPTSSVISDSESVVSEEVDQNVGNLAVTSFGGVMRPLTFSCKPGDDILMKISLVSENYNHTSFCMSARGNVVGPNVFTQDNNIRTFEGVYTLHEFNGFTYPNGGTAIFRFVMTFGSLDGPHFGGRVSGPLIAASEVHVFLFVSVIAVEDSDDDTYSNEDSDSDSGQSSVHDQ